MLGSESANITPLPKIDGLKNEDMKNDFAISFLPFICNLVAKAIEANT